MIVVTVTHHDKNQFLQPSSNLPDFFQEIFRLSFKAVEEEPPGGNREIDLVSHLHNL